MKDDILKVLLTQEQISARVAEMGAELAKDFCDKNPMFIGVLKGSFVFMSDLVRCTEIKCSLDFMSVSSYGRGTSTTGEVKINKDLGQDIAGRHIIIVEDILDSGITLNYLVGYLKNRQPESITLVALLDKPSRRRAPVNANLTGFQVPDEFVVGYGLDFAESYRNLPYIGVLKPEIYAM
ncbi:MAG: hypoxanthine phosphoribosyltransferase [Oscillospiraceae bacterium]|jgi:hypoxanthine phosphoribosyltransferase|nr:hypoxanthine phosphoribosyltransferase [Oscillospiraceae bacterium]